MLSSCEDQFPDMIPALKYINADKHSISFSASKYSNYNITDDTSPEPQTIRITALDADWIVTGKPSWITLDKDKGSGNGEVRVSADVYYNTSSSRSATIYLRSADEKDNIVIPINIEQKEAGEILKLSATRIDLSCNETTEVVNLNCNCEWTWSCNASWVKVYSKRLDSTNSLNTDELTISVEPNTGTFSRSTTINFKSADQSTSLYVYQAGNY